MRHENKCSSIIVTAVVNHILSSHHVRTLEEWRRRMDSSASWFLPPHVGVEKKVEKKKNRQTGNK